MHTEVLNRMSLFEGCDPEALSQLLREAPNSLRTYKEGEFIARQGDVCRSLFILMKGNVRTQMENAEGKQLTIDRIKHPIFCTGFYLCLGEPLPGECGSNGTLRGACHGPETF